jgi:hypothetical protein
MRRAAAVALLALAAYGFSPVAAAAEDKPEKPKKDPWTLKMFRFEFDNDSFIGSDDAFSAGWSFQWHSNLMDRWDPAYAGWIGKVPGLGDDGQGRRIVRWAYALSQIIVTPKDVSIAEPQPMDAPWAGLLGLTGTWSAYDNRRLGAIQVYLGCMGPCSFGEQVQTFIHEDLGFGEPPQGWDNQLSNKALANLNYKYSYKLLADDLADYVPGRFAQDFGVGGQAAAGNLATHVAAELEYRFGWGVPMGFTKIPDPPGFGLVLDPVYLDPEQPLGGDLYRWRFYFNVVARAMYIAYLSPAEGGPTESGYNHPKLEPYPGERVGLFGIHLTRVPFSVHVTYYRYFGGPEDVDSKTDWVNFSFEYRY